MRNSTKLLLIGFIAPLICTIIINVTIDTGSYIIAIIAYPLMLFLTFSFLLPLHKLNKIYNFTRIKQILIVVVISSFGGLLVFLILFSPAIIKNPSEMISSGLPLIWNYVSLGLSVGIISWLLYSYGPLKISNHVREQAYPEASHEVESTSARAVKFSSLTFIVIIGIPLILSATIYTFSIFQPDYKIDNNINADEIENTYGHILDVIIAHYGHVDFDLKRAQSEELSKKIENQLRSDDSVIQVMIDVAPKNAMQVGRQLYIFDDNVTILNEQYVSKSVEHNNSGLIRGYIETNTQKEYDILKYTKTIKYADGVAYLVLKLEYPVIESRFTAN